MNREHKCPKCGSSNTKIDYDFPIMDMNPPVAVAKCNDCSELFEVECEST